MNKVFKLMFLLAVVSVAFTSCQKGSVKKPDDSTSAAAPNSIIGTWQWVEQKGGPNNVDLDVTSNNITYSFAPDSIYVYNPGNKGGTYHITKQTNIFTHNKQDYITFSNTDLAGLLTLSKDTVTISDNHADPFTYIYVKTKTAD